MNRIRNFGVSAQLEPNREATVLDYSECGENENARLLSVFLIEDSGLIADSRGAAFVNIGGVGTGIEVEVDFIHSNVISVPGQSIRVKARNEGSSTLRLGAAVCEGGFSRNVTLRRTRYRDASLPPGISVDFIVPPFASEVIVECTPQLSRSMRIDLMNGLAGIVLYDRNYAANTLPTKIDLANDVRIVRVFNNGLGDIFSIRALFYLAL